MPDDDPVLLLARLGGVGFTLPAAVIAEKQRRIDRFRPSAGDVDAQLEVVRFLEPFLMASGLAPSAVSNVLRSIPRVGSRCLRAGLPLTMRSLIGVDAINQFLASEGRRFSDEGASRIRSAASQLGRAMRLLPDYPPLQAVFPRTTRGEPYTTRFIELYLDGVRRVAEPLRGDALTLIHLAAAGLEAAAIRDVRGTDVTRLDGQTVIWLQNFGGFGLRRLVGPAGDWIAQRAQSVGPDHLIRPGLSRSRAIEAVIKRLHDQTDLPRFRIQRAVDAWFVGLLDAIGYTDFVQLTGRFWPTHMIDDLSPHLRKATTDGCIDLLVAATDRNDATERNSNDPASLR